MVRVWKGSSVLRPVPKLSLTQARGRHSGCIDESGKFIPARCSGSVPEGRFKSLSGRWDLKKFDGGEL